MKRRVRILYWKEAVTGLSIGALVCSLPGILKAVLLAAGW